MKTTTGAGDGPVLRSPIVWVAGGLVVAVHLLLLAVLGADPPKVVGQRSSAGQTVAPPIIARSLGRARAGADLSAGDADDVVAASRTPVMQVAQGARGPGGDSDHVLAFTTTLSLPSAAHYFAAEEVELLPSLPDSLSYGALDVAAWTLTLRLWVSADGQLDHVEVLAANPDGAWQMRVLNALAAMKLEPGQLAGAAVPVQFDVQLGPDTLW